MRASIGTLAVLGLRQIRMDAVPTTAYLMTSGRCSGDCAYCGQGQGAVGDHDRLSRITWPEVSEDQLIEAFVSHPGAFQRVCFQTTASRGVLRQVLALAPRIQKASNTPISVSYRVTTREEADQLFGAGIQRIGVAIDCCSQRLYPQLRGGSLFDSVSLVKQLAALYPGRISTHLIVGLGESEMEAAELMLDLHRSDVLVSLFAFTPVRGTPMEHGSPPALVSYRKLQLLLGLLDWQKEEQFSVVYDAGSIHGFSLDEAQIRSFLQRHFVFVTHGCPGCNRPFYTEAPGGTMFNFPSVPTGAGRREVDEFIDELKSEDFDFGSKRGFCETGIPSRDARQHGA
ncbi:MAG TPA: radical SAM protein [Clostridia bacterium]|nr:radical SAM protein [Clostridia bacterium]